jgi:CheY-like chemotaxis protein
MKMAPDDPNRQNIENMLEASDRAAYLTKDLLLFSRKQEIDKKPLDLNGIIRKLEKFLARIIGEDISFHTGLHDSELLVLADTHQLEQVLMNLTTNARDAMLKGGTFTLTTGQVRLDEQFIALHGYGRSEMYALMTVSDTGTGMDEETLTRIYEPFYTTKEVGKGTGLGLAVVYGIVTQHEGYINAYSEPGIGTTFRIYLPLLSSRQREEKAQPELTFPARGTETILLAEDNNAVRNLTETVLRDAGYTVISAVDGEDAVNKYREHKEIVQLLLFDLIMPRKGGKEAYDEIRKIRPDIKILFTSGYSPDIVRDKTSLGSSATIAYKPISPMDLLQKVRNLLDV